MEMNAVEIFVTMEGLAEMDVPATPVCVPHVILAPTVSTLLAISASMHDMDEISQMKMDG